MIAPLSKRRFRSIDFFLFRFDERGDFGFHHFAGFERNDVLGGNFDHIARLWISGIARLAAFDFKHTEVAEFDPSILDERLDNRVECFLDEFLRQNFGDSEVFGNRTSNLFFGLHGVGKKRWVESRNGNRLALVGTETSFDHYR